MHPRSSFLSLVTAAALGVLTGCATTSSQTPPSEPVTNPTPPSGPTAWSTARVGDRVVYAFTANRANVGQKDEARVAGRLALEVVAVQAPWVWLKLSTTDEAGKPSASLPLSKELVFPMSMEASRSLEWTRPGTPTAEQLSAAGRTWEAQRYTEDKRPVDGPLENRLYASSPGPLYLTNGLLSASTTLSGFGASGGHQLTLVEVQQGTEGSTGTPPSLQYPLGPGTWADTRVNPGSGETVNRTCLGAERGFLLSSTGPAPAAGGAPCPSFREAEAVPVEEALHALAPWMADQLRAPRSTRTPSRRGALDVKGLKVPSITFEASETAENAQQVRAESYAADPWDASLDGLHYQARFDALAESVERVEGKSRKPVFTQQLSDWGTWAGAAK
jgi:hypothetical protein